MKYIKYSPKFFKSKYTRTRKGEFKIFELNYINLLCFLFKKGNLNIPHNYPLRIFLAHCLGCKPMRISKLKKGAEAINKQRYIHYNNLISNDTIKLFNKVQSVFLENIDSNLKILIPSICNEQIQLLDFIKVDKKTNSFLEEIDLFTFDDDFNPIDIYNPFNLTNSDLIKIE